MQKNWYILYTKSGSEKKVAAALSKRKIDHFLPLCNKVNNYSSMNRSSKEPLFTGYVFVLISSTQLTEVQEAAGAISMVYWKGKPVTVPLDDIETIKDFTSTYDKIELVQIKVNMHERNIPVDSAPLIVSETTLNTFHRHSSKVTLRSLGYIMVAEHEDVFKINTVKRYQREEKVLN